LLEKLNSLNLKNEFEEEESECTMDYDAGMWEILAGLCWFQSERGEEASRTTVE